ncbi:MAG: oligosaccharide flippase family protein [Clostridia bacterium]|nr:oligosaccharide flippase family protein [Clostridia bacterium]
MKRKDNSSVYRTVFGITLFSTIDQIGGFVYTIILSRAIGAQGLGAYQVASNLVSLVVAISASGLPFVLGRRVAEFDAVGDKKGINSSLCAGLVTGCVLSLLLCTLFLTNNNLLVAITKSGQIATMCLFLLPASFANSVYACFRGALWGKKEYIKHSSLEIIDIVIRIFLALAIFHGFFSQYEGGLRACLAYSCACTITAFVSFVFYKKSGGGFASPKGHFAPVIKSIIPVSGIRIAGSVFTTVIAFLFNLRMTSAGYASADIMAQYGILTGMVLPLIAFPIIFTSAIATTLVPEISGNLKTGNVAKVQSHLKKAIDYTFLFGGLAIGVYLAFAPSICNVVFANEQAGLYVRESCWIMIPLGVASLTTSLQNSLGLEYKSLVSYFAGGLCMVVCLWFLPQYVGPNSLVFGTGIGMTVTSVINVRIICKKTNLHGNFGKTLLCVCIFALVSGVTGLCLANLCTLCMSTTFSLVLCCVLCVVVYLVLTITFDTAEICTLFKNVRYAIPKKQKTKPLQ